MALEFYKKTIIPDEAFPKALCGVALMNYYNTAITIFNDKVNEINIKYFMLEWKNFMSKKVEKIVMKRLLK